jgi:ABC-type transport system involved in cytochrome c biogenesis permease subunit
MYKLMRYQPVETVVGCHAHTSVSMRCDEYTCPRQAWALHRKYSRYLIGIAVFLAAVCAMDCAARAADFDWQAWRYLPVQDGGRYKPLDTVARETARLFGDKTGFPDPKTGRKLSPIELYLTLLFAGRPDNRAADGAARNWFDIDRPDDWDNAPLLRVDSVALREALQMPADKNRVSPLELSKATYRDADFDRPIALMTEVHRLSDLQEKRKLTPYEQEVLRLAGAFQTYQFIRLGQQPRFVPVPGADGQWLSFKQLLADDLPDAGDSSRLLATAHAELVLINMRARDPNGKEAGEFNADSAALFNTLARLGAERDAYPSQTTISLEVAYNSWAPFHWAWFCTAAAFILAAASWISGKRFFRLAGLSMVALALAVMLAGFCMRGAISGWVPLTNMYETVVCLAFEAALFGLLFELFFRRSHLLVDAAAISTIALVLADIGPSALDSSIRPITPVLRSNFWLMIHVMTVMTGYVAFALAWMRGNIALGFIASRGRDAAVVEELNKINALMLRIGVLMLCIGTLLGAVWAEFAWGRFWGWDPKEVWALITLLGYLALLHARRIGWARQYGLAAWSVGCFVLVLCAWYFVNLILGLGLHSYGFGGGSSLIYVSSAIALQAIYLAAATMIVLAKQR